MQILQEQEFATTFGDTVLNAVAEAGCIIIEIRNVASLRADLINDNFALSAIGRCAAYTYNHFGCVPAPLTISIYT